MTASTVGSPITQTTSEDSNPLVETRPRRRLTKKRVIAAALACVLAGGATAAYLSTDAELVEIFKQMATATGLVPASCAEFSNAAWPSRLCA